MAAYKMAAVKVTPPNYFPLGLIRSHMVVIHLFLMLCDLQRVVCDLRSTLYFVFDSHRLSFTPIQIAHKPCFMRGARSGALVEALRYKP
jgi:hypothetical protein